MKSRHDYLEIKPGRILVAVFDSLREGLVFHERLKKTIKIGEFRSEPVFCLMDIDTEPVLLENYNLSVTMEVYQVSESILDDLDAYYDFYHEGYDLNLTNRKKINTPYGEAYIYINNLMLREAKVIQSGDWKDYLEYNNRSSTKKRKFETLIK